MSAAPSGVESALFFACAGEQLLGIVADPGRGAETAVLIVVGGPQYRAGSHRQFTLLARALAAAGTPSLRFDYRGMGDSSGELRDFEQVDADIGAAIDALVAAVPGVRRVVLWGLCDAASAALLYVGARHDRRVAGLCLLNPWVRSEATLARAHVKHYYLQRLLQPAFWKKLLGGGVGVASALGEFFGKLRQSRAAGANAGPLPGFQQRMAEAAAGFAGEILLVLSGNDYTAREFVEHSAASATWQRVLRSPHLTRVEFADADHTFSSARFRTAVENACRDWLQTRIDGAGSG